jgi:arylformamidase
MHTSIEYQQQIYTLDLSHPLDISMPLNEGLHNANAFYAPPVQYEPVKAGSFIGDVKQGGAVNFKNVFFNPHGNGTHTECVGHIAAKPYTINQCLQHFFFLANLISIYPQKLDNGDRVITKAQIIMALNNMPKNNTALIIRTFPNDELKCQTNYSGSNPPYLHHEAVKYIVTLGIKHLLIDLPSVDREEDGGKLLAHKAFWQYPEKPRLDSTITELIYVPNTVKDGLYWLNLQIASFELDASPSKPVLYKTTII